MFLPQRRFDTMSKSSGDFSLSGGLIPHTRAVVKLTSEEVRHHVQKMKKKENTRAN